MQEMYGPVQIPSDYKVIILSLRPVLNRFQHSQCLYYSMGFSSAFVRYDDGQKEISVQLYQCSWENILGDIFVNINFVHSVQK